MKQSISVVIPARNEEEYLPACLMALKHSASLANCELELIVVVNRCTDATEKIALQAGCKVVYSEAKNLSIIRNTGVNIASHKFVATVDADSCVCPHMVTNLIKHLNDSSVIGGGVMMYASRCSLGIFLTGVMLLPMVFWHGISGGLFFFRKTDFDAIKGFDETLFSAEDIDFAKRLRDHGKLDQRKFLTLWRTYITTSARKFDRFGDWYFLFRPGLLWTLVKGKDPEAANKIWYDFERDTSRK